jgi:protein ImuA
MTKADIIARLKKEILPLQGLKSLDTSSAIDVKLGAMKYAFPDNRFPLSAVHEFVCSSSENVAATCGFIAGLLSFLTETNGVCIWVTNASPVFTIALKKFNVEPDKIIFIQLKKNKDTLWAAEEALKCNGLSAVICEVSNLDFTSSRRLQLAVEKSNVTGFIIRHTSKFPNTTTCVTRWQITSAASQFTDDVPGVAFPRWNVNLLKVRNGRPGNWLIEWNKNSFTYIPKIAAIPQQELYKKTR